MKTNGPWKIKDSQVKYKNPWISVREDQVIRPDGKDGIFGVVEMVAGASVLPLDDDGFVYLTKEFHYAIEQDSVEVVSGAIDEGETALEAAKRGIGFTAPNPCVGAILVKDGIIIGEGWHKRVGNSHAEAMAIENAKEQQHSIKGSTLYVTLEPCCQYGRTPPCGSSEATACRASCADRSRPAHRASAGRCG